MCCKIHCGQSFHRHFPLNIDDLAIGISSILKEFGAAGRGAPHSGYVHRRLAQQQVNYPLAVGNLCNCSNNTDQRISLVTELDAEKENKQQLRVELLICQYFLIFLNFCLWDRQPKPVDIFVKKKKSLRG